MACINPNDPKFKEILARVGNQLIAQIEFDKLTAGEITQPKTSINKFEGQMTYSYGQSKRSDVTADTTFDAIVTGQRTATTRYESDGNLSYWKNAKVGDTITWTSKDGRTVDVVVTKVLTPLKGSGKTPQTWSKLEGWSVDYFEKKVRPKLDEAWQIEFKLATQPQSPVSREVNFEEDQTTGYAARTRKNASADATIALAVDFTSAGERLTKSSVLEQNKKYIPIDANNLSDIGFRAGKIVEMLNSINAKTLNIAGNGIYTMKGKYTQEQVDTFTYELLKAVIESPNLKTKIESIRTGGQTGFDEAGAKAGLKLGIPTKILAPKGWKFRDINGKDISNENLFKSRFGEVIAKPATKPEVKPGVSELFESNPELANAVYEALGFETNISIPNYEVVTRPTKDIGKSKGRTGNFIEITTPDNYRTNMSAYMVQTNDDGKLFITDIEKYNKDSTFKGFGLVAYVDFFENYKNQGITTDKKLTADGIKLLERLEKIGLVYKTDAKLIDDSQVSKVYNTKIYEYNKPLYEFNLNWSRNQTTAQQKQQAQQQYFQYLKSIFKKSQIVWKGFTETNKANKWFALDKEYAQTWGTARPMLINTEDVFDISEFEKYFEPSKSTNLVMGELLIKSKFEQQLLDLSFDNPKAAEEFSKRFDKSSVISGPEAGFENNKSFYVKNTNDVYEIGSKQDIEGFKKFVIQPVAQTVTQPQTTTEESKTEAKLSETQISESLTIKSEDISFKSNRLEIFERAEGLSSVKGYSLVIKGQPNVDFFTYKDADGWNIIDNVSKLKLPLRGTFNGTSKTKDQISELLSSTLNYYRTLESSKKILEKVGFKFTKTSEVTTKVEPSTLQDRLVTVAQFKITVKSDGRMFYDNGNEVTDQTTKNKVEVNMAYLDGNLRVSLYNEAEYFVLSDNRIIKADKTDKGKETIKDPKIIMSILEKATPFKKNCP